MFYRFLCYPFYLYMTQSYTTISLQHFYVFYSIIYAQSDFLLSHFLDYFARTLLYFYYRYFYLTFP